ncbi:MAG: hypothetical protein RQ760_22125 [Sedimentisphaerales bacterium]|nr:hypothetical protein [Sedimentisphaerales bacterium]
MQPDICGFFHSASEISVVFLVEEFVCITGGAKAPMLAALWFAHQVFFNISFKTQIALLKKGGSAKLQQYLVKV